MGIDVGFRCKDLQKASCTASRRFFPPQVLGLARGAAPEEIERAYKATPTEPIPQRNMYIHVYIYISLYTHFLNVCMGICLYAYRYVHACVIYIYILHKHLHVYICIYIHTYVYTSYAGGVGLRKVVLRYLADVPWRVCSEQSHIWELMTFRLEPSRHP